MKMHAVSEVVAAPVAQPATAELSPLNDALGALQEELERLRTAAEHIEDSKEAARKAVDAARHVGQAAAGLTAQTDTLIGKLDRVDFPTRLDKLDATTSTLHGGFQLIQGRLESVERNVQEGTARVVEASLQPVRAQLEAIEQAVESVAGELRQQSAAQMKLMGQLRWLLVGTFLGVAALIALVVLRT